MLPSRGLRLRPRPRPTQFNSSASRQSPVFHCNASRKLSSLRRTIGPSIASCRTNPLQCTQPKIGMARNSNALPTTSFVRHGSWYAPWSWGGSSKPSAPADQPPAVTSNTPELAPAGVDKAPVVDGTTHMAAETFGDSKSMEDILGLDPVQDTLPADPAQLIDHAGHLKELGLEYGLGMTSVFEKVIETVYLTSGWGWAGSIVASGVLVRCVTFYFQIQTSHRMATIASLKPITAPIQARMEEAIAKGDKQLADVYRSQQQMIMKPYMGGFMSVGGFMLVQAYIGFCAFRFLRAMGELPVPGMSQDGFLWFVDLTHRDPYYILPIATATIMYTVFKTVGETGVSNEMGAGASKKHIVTIMAVVFGFVTSFQPAGLQLYFLNSTVVGGCTGWLLRQNEFRRLVGIRIIPSKESNELYSRVASGEIKLKDIRGPDGRLRYRAPTPVESRSVTTLPGIKIKSGTALPLHLRPNTPKLDRVRPDRDIDFHEGAKGSLLEKLSYYRRNYRLRFVWRRLMDAMEKTAVKGGYMKPKLSEEQAKRKRKAQEYEMERMRRFQNRK